LMSSLVLVMFCCSTGLEDDMIIWLFRGNGKVGHAVGFSEKSERGRDGRVMLRKEK